MPDSGMIFFSVASVVVGSLLFLSPQSLVGLGHWLNTSLVTCDSWLIRHRYTTGVLAFAASYAFFRLALLLPSLGR